MSGSAEAKKRYRESHREKIRAHGREYGLKYYREHLEECREKGKINYHSNKERMKKLAKDWKKNNRDRYLAQYRKSHSAHRKAKPYLHLMHRVVQDMMRRTNLKKSAKSREYVGCSPEFLRGWIESQFHDGMTWENYGTVWVVDHIVPLKWWDVDNFPQHLYEASHYSNLQPMFKRDNVVKGARFCS